jgi:small-conductance mechanosensitive channel
VWICLQSPVEGVLSIDDLIATSTDKKKEEWEQPQNPATLNPSWWDYYTVGGEDLEKRINASKDYFTHLSDIAPEENREEINGYIQKILINLDALPKLRAQTIPKFQPTPFLDEYTLDQLLDIVSKRKQLEALSSEESKELQQDQDRAKKVKHHIDVLLAGYIDLKSQNVQKEIAGLEMMSLRIALAISEENIRLMGERTAQYHDEIVHLKNETAYAKGRLNVGSVNISQLNKDLAIAQDTLKHAQDLALNSEMNALGIVGDDHLERAVNFMQLQRSVLDNAKEALAQANVIFISAKRALVHLLEDSAEAPQNELTEDLTAWQGELKFIKDQVEDWISKTEQENDRSMLPITLAEDAPLAQVKEKDRIQQLRTKTVQETIEVLNQLKLKLNFDELLIRDINERMQKKEGAAFSWFYAVLGFVEECCQPIYGWLYTPLLKIGGVPLTVVSLLRLILIIGLTYGLSLLLRRILNRANKSKMHMTDASVFIIDRMVHYLVLIIGFALALASIGLSLSSLAIILGALSVGIGFGLQNIVNNFFSSLIIMFSRTLKVGDVIEINDNSYGQVTAINVQNTVIHTNDGIDVVIPNSEIMSSRLVNWTLNDNFRRVHIPFSVAYGTDKELVTKAAIEAAEKVPCTVKNASYVKEPQVWMVGFGDCAINFELVVWVNVYGFGHRGSMKASYLWELDNALAKYKIVVPFPQREIKIIRASDLNDDELHKVVPVEGLGIKNAN